MNTSLTPTPDNEFHAIGEHIGKQLSQSFKKSYDIFFDIVSSAIWQSPRELAVSWMMRTTPQEWKSLQDVPSDTAEVRSKKQSVRRSLMTELYQVLANIWMRPSFLQRISTRLLVKNTLAHTLPTNDQDRIIAAELMTTYPLWKSLLSTMSLHNIVTDERPLAATPYFFINPEGEDDCRLTVRGHIDPIDTLPDLPIHHDADGMMLLVGPVIFDLRSHVSHILVPQNVLKRHGDVINPGENEGKIRSSILGGLGGVPVFKKRSFGSTPDKEELQGAWQANPA